MITEMSKFDILYLLNSRIKSLKSIVDGINSYCANIYEDGDDYKVLFLTSEFFLQELSDFYKMLYNLDKHCYEDKNAKIKVIAKNLIKEIVDIETYSISFYSKYVEDENLEGFLCEYRGRVEVIVNNLMKHSTSVKNIMEDNKLKL